MLAGTHARSDAILEGGFKPKGLVLAGWVATGSPHCRLMLGLPSAAGHRQIPPAPPGLLSTQATAAAGELVAPLGNVPEEGGNATWQPGLMGEV